MTRFTLPFLIIILVLTSCVSSNVLTYKNRRFYKEINIVGSGSIFELDQLICYDRPRLIDGGFCYCLNLIILDTSAAKSKRILDLQADTNIVKSEFGIYSVWNWENENNTVSGKIEIIHWDKDSVILKENIVATDFRKKKTKKYKGTRTFIKEEK